MNDWSDGKRFLFDHIFDSVVFGAMLLLGLFLDPLLNLLYSCGVSLVPHEAAVHPFEFGRYQVILLVVGALKVARLGQKLIQWRYYS